MEHEQILKEYELSRSQLELYQQNLELIDGRLSELRMIDNALDEIKDTNKNNEMLVPIGGDTFIKASIIDPENVIVGVGASVAVKKTIGDAKEDIEDKIAELEKVRADHTSNLEKLISKLRELEPSVQSIVSQAVKKED
ncbi:MAG: prefoldin subunit alpha [Candidatus Hydrothermarchaeaceae archaeon]